MGGLIQDVRYGVRQMVKAPGFTATVAGVLALGIGANAAMFTVLGGTLLRRLPYRDVSRVVTVQSMDTRGDTAWTNLLDIESWQQRGKTLDAVGYYAGSSGTIEGAAGTREVSKTAVSAGLFDVLGVVPGMGRGVTAEDQVPGRDGIAVLSYAAWQEMFGAAPDVVGKVVRIDDAPVTVVGVMPEGFAFPVNEKAPQVWVPVPITTTTRVRNFAAGSFQVVARLRGGVSEALATAELSGVQRENAKLYPADEGKDLIPSSVQVTGYRSGLVKDQRPALLALMGAVGMVWLIACANVANLMLARSTARRREMAVRGALGASAWQLVRQMLVESLLLSLAGAAVGVGLAWATLMAFRHALEASLYTKIAEVPDVRVLGALLGLSVVSALLFGVAPAMIGVRTPLDQTLRSGGAQAGTGRRQHRVQRALVVGEIGLSLTMLVGCGLLLRTVFALRQVPLGFRTDHVFVMTPRLPSAKYKAVDVNEVVYKPLLERVRAMHGVEAAALTTVMPLSKGFQVTLALNTGKDAKDKTEKGSILATLKAAGPELQKVLGFEMVRGRFFDERDTADAQPVVVVNEAFARKYEETTGPIENFTLGGDGKKEKGVKIIGVIRDFHQVGIADPPKPEVDVCAAQMRHGVGFYQPTLGVRVELALRASRDAKSLIPDLQRAMREVNPDLAATEVRTMDEIVEDAMGSQLLAAHLLEVLGGLALVVALTGLYSLLAYLVTLRRRELGVRLALGAARRDVIALVMRQAGWMLAGGVALGIGLSLATTHLLAHFLFGVKARDGLTMVASAMLMACVGTIAAYLPALRASGIEPMEALRVE